MLVAADVQPKSKQVTQPCISGVALLKKGGAKRWKLLMQLHGGKLDKELETTYNIPDLLTFINVSA